MTWDFGWKAGPKGGALTDLTPYARFVRMASEGIAGKYATNVAIPFQHGTRAVPHKFAMERLVPIVIGYRYTDGAGAITHLNGAAGHAYENKATIERLLGGGRDLVTLQRDEPHHGLLDIDVELVQPTSMAEQRWIYLYTMSSPDGFWRANVESNTAVSPIAVGGNAPVGDAIVEFSSGTGFFEHTASGARIDVAGAPGGVRVYTDTGVAEVIAGGADARQFVTFNRPYYLELDGGVSNAFTASNLSQIRWHDKVR